MKFWHYLSSILAYAIFVKPKIIFLEEFNSGWEQRWNKTSWRGDQQASFNHTQGKFHGIHNSSYGIRTETDMMFYGISARLEYPINASDSPIVIQYSVKFEQSIICGGGYIKILDPYFKARSFGGETQALILFGPDICGNNNRVHIILDNSGRGEAWKRIPESPVDGLTHFFTFALYQNSSYKFFIDTRLTENGTINEDWDITYAKTVQKYLIGGIGIDIWQVKAGTLFDNIMISDSVSEALTFAKGYMLENANEERDKKETADREEKAKYDRDRLIPEDESLKNFDDGKEDL